MASLWEGVVLLWPPLLLLLLANGVPILARWQMAGRFDAPLDGGRYFIDGRPLLGPTKGWRGVVMAVIVTTITGWMLGMAWWLGALLGFLAMVGDTLASFIKRRLAIAPHGRAPVLDQLPESLLPLWLLREELGLTPSLLLVAVLLFILLDMALSPLLYRWHVRLRPY